ncbi:TetR/AcrR family transcriptional regulator [Spirillospora sp. CA-253888]
MASPRDFPAKSRNRRSPSPEERRTDPERTRAALIEAALEEFSAKGFAGARVREIGRRAGVSKDQISYHFGGKLGLYREVRRACAAGADTALEPGSPPVEALARLLRETLRDPRPMRIRIWEGLDSLGPVRAPDAEERRPKGDGEGEVALQILLLAALAAPLIFPHDVERLLGAAPGDPHFEERYLAGLRKALGLDAGGEHCS